MSHILRGNPTYFAPGFYDTYIGLQAASFKRKLLAPSPVELRSWR
jgi:hypothetical protein